MTRKFLNSAARMLVPAHEQRPVQAKGVVHELVAETAKEMCRAYWEGEARDNAFYALWPTSDDFLVKRWHMFIQPARTHLAEMLHPDMHYATTHEQRQIIHDALLKQAAVNPAANMVDKLINGSMH